MDICDNIMFIRWWVADQNAHLIDYMKLREKFLEFLTEDVAYHPLLLFIQISCLHIFRETGLEGVLLCLAIITTFTKLTNYYWFVGVFIMAGSSYVYLINFIFGFLSAN